MNEWLTEWLSDWMSERMSDWMSERTNGWTSDFVPQFKSLHSFNANSRFMEDRTPVFQLQNECPLHRLYLGLKNVKFDTQWNLTQVASPFGYNCLLSKKNGMGYCSNRFMALYHGGWQLIIFHTIIHPSEDLVRLRGKAKQAVILHMNSFNSLFTFVER